MRSLLILLIVVVSMWFVSCNSTKNPEIEKIKIEIEKQNKEKNEKLIAALVLAKRTFQTSNTDTLEQFIEPNENGIVFRDQKTGICLVIIYNKNTKSWNSLGMMKGRPLNEKSIPAETYGESITVMELGKIVNQECSFSAKELLTEKVNKIIEDFNEGKFQTAFMFFSDDLKVSFKQEDILRKLSQLQSKYGKIKKISNTAEILYDAFDYWIDFEKAQMIFRIIIDGGGLIKEFKIIPPLQKIKYPEITLKTKIGDIIKPYVEAKDNHAVVVGILDDGDVTYYKFVDSRSKGVLPDEHSLYEIGSITKVFTTTTLALFADKEMLHLTDNVSKFLPLNVKMPAFGTRQITLLDLATHTSGLPREPLNMNISGKDPFNPYSRYKVKDLYSFLNSYELTTEPGEKAKYSNLGMGLLGHVLARKAGMDYEKLVKKYVLNPLGMSETLITLDEKDRKLLIQGHDPIGRTYPAWDMPVLEGSGAIKSNAADLMKFLMVQTGVTNVKGFENAIKKSHAVYFLDEAEGDTICLGWMEGKNNVGKKFLWHNGITGGYHSFIGFWKDSKSGVIILSNNSNNFYRIDVLGEKLLEYLDARENDRNKRGVFSNEVKK